MSSVGGEGGCEGVRGGEEAGGESGDNEEMGSEGEEEEEGGEREGREVVMVEVGKPEWDCESILRYRLGSQVVF